MQVIHHRIYQPNATTPRAETSHDVSDTRTGQVLFYVSPEISYHDEQWIEVLPDLPVFLPGLVKFTFRLSPTQSVAGRLYTTGTVPAISQVMQPGEERQFVASTTPSGKIEIRVEAQVAAHLSYGNVVDLQVVPPDLPKIKAPPAPKALRV